MKSFREQQEDRANGGNNQTDAAQTIEGLAGMSESQLTALLASEAAKAKQNGTLNADTLRTFWDQMAPMLSEEQREKLKGLLDMIK